MKKLSIGIIIGLMLGLSTNAFAAIGDSVTAVFAKFTYVVNGETKTVEDPVLVYEGMSYLRTTQISNMLGYDVTYKSDSRTIEFNKPETVVQPVPIQDEVTPSNDAETPQGEVTTPVDGTTSEPVNDQAPVTDGTTVQEPVTEPVVEEPLPDNTATCQAIRDSWNSKIYSYNGKNPKEQEFTRNQMAAQRDSELASAGCN